MLKNDKHNLHLGNSDRLKFKKLYNVSRETINKLEIYEEYILRFNAKFNLIGSGTVRLVWSRHFADSAKLFFLIKLNFVVKVIKCCIFASCFYPLFVMFLINNHKKFCNIVLIANIKAS